MQLIRTIPVQTNARLISIDKEKKIVRDIKIRKLNINIVAEKHNVKKKTISRLLRNWRVKGDPVMNLKQDAKPNAEPPTQVIVIAQKDVEFLSFLMAEYKMYFHIPEYYKLTETIESKMNPRDLIITASI